METRSRIIRRARTFLTKYPSLYFPLARAKKGDWLVSKDTDVVIEGFPRSGNSFCEAAFRVAGNDHLSIAHHCHSAAQILRAADLGIPALVVIREPRSSCRSLMMHRPRQFTVADTLYEYTLFHKAIRKVRDSFVLATFDTVTTDFGRVVDVMNKKYDTSFSRFDHTDDNEAAAFAKLDSLSQARGTAAKGGEPYSPQQSDDAADERVRLKEEFASMIADPRYADALAEADAVFNALNSSADI